MKKEVKNEYPVWVNDEYKYNMCMCLSDDLDSLASCILLQKIKGYQISHFYSFSKLYRGDNYKENEKLCGIDIDLVNGRCWGNHVTGIKNPKSANLNVIKNINMNNYYSKYAGSTILQIISCYDIDINNLSDEAKIVLLSIDSTYLSYYFNKDTCKYWLVDLLQLNSLWDTLLQLDKKDYEQVINKYNLKSKITIDKDGYLKTNIDLQGLSTLFDVSFFMPKIKFTENGSYIDKGINYYQYNSFKKQLEENGGSIFSQALTNKTFIKLSYER